MKNPTHSFRRDFDRVVSARDAAVFLLIPCVLLVLLAVCLGFFFGLFAWIPVASVLIFFWVGTLLWVKHCERRDVGLPSPSLALTLKHSLSRFFDSVDRPIFISDQNGFFVWYNACMKRDFSPSLPKQGTLVKDYFSFAEGESGNHVCKFGTKEYEVFSTSMLIGEKEYRIADLMDRDTFLREKEKNENDRLVMGILSIDNLQEAAQIAGDKIDIHLVQVLAKIRSWVAKKGAILIPYENNKHMILMDNKCLQNCIKDQFSILDEVRLIRIADDSISLTVSIGIARVETSLEECHQNAEKALDLAIQRGGGQVVCKRGKNTDFFGGRVKALYKRTSVRSRVFASQLCSEIEQASNVLIMGHDRADSDSLGACVGMAKIVSYLGKIAEIVKGKNDQSVEETIQYVSSFEDYKNSFISSAKAVDRISPKTLLIIVDVNIPEMVASPDVFNKVQKAVIIDHHIQPPQEPSSKVCLSFIEPSASSASELVTEFLEYGLSIRALSEVESELLYAGIILDTKQFTQNTNERTFAAAQYLLHMGVNAGNATNLYRISLDDFTKESRLLSGAFMYRDRIAICEEEKAPSDSYRILGAKAADQLLSVKGVDASFAIVRVGEQIYVSARSASDINVQFIMQECGGGGHFNVAAASFPNQKVKNVKTTHDVKNVIVRAIDHFLSQSSSNVTPVR